MKSESPIVPSAHQPALFFTQPGTLDASAVVAHVTKSKAEEIQAKSTFIRENTL